MILYLGLNAGQFLFRGGGQNAHAGSFGVCAGKIVDEPHQQLGVLGYAAQFDDRFHFSVFGIDIRRDPVGAVI